jgi:hypothetical protein
LLNFHGLLQFFLSKNGQRIRFEGAQKCINPNGSTFRNTRLPLSRNSTLKISDFATDAFRKKKKAEVSGALILSETSRFQPKTLYFQPQT